ncbi:Retrovirus-related Pol polyprotein from transposon RE2 [Vitis vinifera]|uniref:Retrovirus-related Pol polyprotein from transposon RE2 n=1 Tax=Vitis vinifera TaxID=29760 RepID=A0A438CW31_VITVI|nr:Retrovirus-related Pol polyprotein from transposon RE2 [Vitis vinifera]
MGQGYEDHLVTQEADIPEIDKFFMVLTLIGLRPDLETVRDQILGSSSIPSLDDVFARLLHISSTQTLPSDNTSDSSVLVSQTNSRGGRSGNRGRGQRPHCTYCNKLGHTHDRCYQLHGRPPRTAHVAQSSDPQSPQPSSSSTSQGISLTDGEYDDYLRYQATKSAFVASVAQIDNVSAYLTHTSSLGPWILDSGASDHISGNKDLFSSITTTSTLPTVTLLMVPKLWLKDRSTGKTIGIGHESQGLYHLTSPSTPAVCISTNAPLIHSRLGHPSLSKFQKMVPHFSSLSSLACESCQLGKHTRVSFPKRLNNRAKSPFELIHTDVWGPCRTASTLGFQYFVTFIYDYSRLTMPGNIFLHHLLHLCSNMGSFISLSCAHTPQQNGTAKRKNRHLIETDSPFFSTSESLPVSEVLPLPIISPPDAVPSRPLQVYHRRHRVAVPPSLAEVPADSLPIPSASPAPTLPPSADLPIALRKSTPEAFSHPGWQQAMVDEMVALHSNGTWDLVVLPSGKSTVGCHWVYTVKVGPDGQIAFVRLLLSMAAMRSWPLYQLDIKNVFLHGDLAEEVYMEQPPGFVAQRESGLEFGMFRSTTDHSVFYHHNYSGQCICLVVYVDDIVITGSDQNGIQKLKQHLFTHFQTKDLGKLKYFLGIEIAQSNSNVVLSQRKYALDILEETGMLNCKPIDTPMDPNVKLIPGQGEPLGDLGDIGDFHWDAVIRILRYIKSTPGQGVLYKNRGHTQVDGYTDADWASSPTDRRSTSRYCVFIGGNLISWKSKNKM